MKVRAYLHAAVVTYVTNDKGRYKGQDITGRYRWTDVFVLRTGRNVAHRGEPRNAHSAAGEKIGTSPSPWSSPGRFPPTDVRTRAEWRSVLICRHSAARATCIHHDVALALTRARNCNTGCSRVELIAATHALPEPGGREKSPIYAQSSDRRGIIALSGSVGAAQLLWRRTRDDMRVKTLLGSRSPAACRDPVTTRSRSWCRRTPAPTLESARSRSATRSC